MKRYVNKIIRVVYKELAVDSNLKFCKIKFREYSQQIDTDKYWRIYDKVNSVCRAA